MADKTRDEVIHAAYMQITKGNIYFTGSIQNNPLQKYEVTLEQNSQQSRTGANLTFLLQTVNTEEMSSLSEETLLHVISS